MITCRKIIVMSLSNNYTIANFLTRSGLISMRVKHEPNIKWKVKINEI